MNDNDVIHLSAIAWLGTIASRCLDSLGRATEPFGRDVPDLSPALRAAVDQATAGHEALRTSAEAELHRALEDSR